MKSDMLLQAEEYSRKRRRQKRRRRLISCLGAVVVFCTTYALILPAITLENDYICGQAEHLHDDSCYVTTQTEAFTTALTCAPDCHVHTAECFDETGQVICGLADRLLHSHDENCYDGTGQLICPLPEAAEHLHSDSCWQEERTLCCTLTENYHIHEDGCYTTLQGELICPLEESEEHEHTDECYDRAQTLTCEIPENPEGHRHSEECYETTRTLVCQQEQIALHEHTEECRDENGALICGILSAGEHQHTDECLSTTSAGFTEETLLLCGWEEHTHTDECLPPEPEETEPPDTAAEDLSDSARTVMEQIDALPTGEEIGIILAAYEDSGYEDGGQAYFLEMAIRARAVYDAYQALSPEEQAQIPNADRLLELEWLWGAETLTENFSFADPTIVRSASTKDFIDLNLYDYNGYINDRYDSNKKYPGFQWNGGAYMDSNTFNRHVVDYIDFGNSNITDRAYGGTASGITNGISKNKVTVGVLYNNGSQGNTDTINWLWWDGTNASITNRPVGMSTMSSSALSLKLGDDGYPALADGTSLAYLFTDDNYSVSKENTQSIDGLFQYNDTTGAYYYNSRENHAHYSNNTFTLYNQIITPNFIVYPFGNFLPFNTITDSSKATQVSSINGSSGNTVSDYVQKIQDDLTGRSTYNDSPTSQQLSAMLEKYQTSITGDSITTAKQAITDYLISGGTTTTDLISDAQLNRLYNIDWDEETNFFFGMDMSMNFFQPKGGMTGKDTNGDGTPDHPMEFYFTGDDDVWVYIDDVLFLDLSGIHRHVGGKIDFVNGKVYYYELDTAGTGDVSGTPYATYTFKQLLEAAGKPTDGLNEKGAFKDYSTHTFKFYYMERGSGSSVCRMNFNFPLLRKNSISVTKELTVDDTSKLPLLGDPDFKFQVLKENKTDLFIGANVSYDILDTSGTKISTGRTDANGVFTLKAGQTAVFSGIEENAGKYFVRELLDKDVFGQYGTVSVNGSSITQNYNVTVGSDSFTGLDSPMQDVSNGSTAFRFDNNVTTSKLGSLTIQKTITDYEKARTAKQFQLDVTLDGEKLPVGTTYTVDGATRSVTTAGTITLAPNETATISNILAGTKFTVQETAASAEGYVVSYTVGNTTTSDKASGVIGVNSTVAVTVNNAEKGASVEIPVTKALLTPDGKEHTYQFTLTQVTDSSGTAETPDGTTQVLELPVTTETVTDCFTIDYPLVDLDALPQTFYYKIAEEQQQNTNTVFDQSVYVVQVTINVEGNAAVTGIWKDGTAYTEQAVAFTNQILRYELPQTGGAGTYRYTIAGIALIAAACLMYHRAKRRKGAQSPG